MEITGVFVTVIFSLVELHSFAGITSFVSLLIRTLIDTCFSARVVLLLSSFTVTNTSLVIPLSLETIILAVPDLCEYNFVLIPLNVPKDITS